MDEHPKKRPWFWFQYHLSTALVLMLVVGGLMWANMGNQGTDWGRAEDLDTRDIPHYAKHEYGWPLEFYSRCAMYLRDSSDVVVQWNKANLALDVLVAIALVYAVALLLEWRIRRKERRP
jgi:hypothetical protein